MMLWEVEIHPKGTASDREGTRVGKQCRALKVESVTNVRSARSFLLEGDLSAEAVERIANGFLVDTLVENYRCHPLGTAAGAATPTAEAAPAGEAAAPETAATPANGAGSTNGVGTANGAARGKLVNVLFKAGVTDQVAESVKKALGDLGHAVAAVRTCQKYWFNDTAKEDDLQRVATKVLANDAIQQVVWGDLQLESLEVGTNYTFQLVTVPIREMNDEQLQDLSKRGQLYLSLPEMQTIRQHFVDLGRDPTDAELETVAQTWSEHCSHKTLRGRVKYRDEGGERQFENLLKETIFAATSELRQQLGDQDWCVSVFQDNAGVVKFDDEQHVCFKVETHNHPSALEPYGGANTGLGGVIRDPMGTGLGAKPIASTDVFCFAPPGMSHDKLPPGVLHPRAVMTGVVSGVRDYGNRMGIPTVNGAVYFDERYLGNPLVYCGNVAMLPVGLVAKHVQPGDYIVAVGGRTGRDGIHGATFSSAELTHESETISGGAVQIGNAITEKMMLDVLLQARDQGLYTAITDCGAGGFSSAVGEMGAETGAEVWLEQAPLKYSGLSYTEIWISEAQERMVVSVPRQHWDAFHKLCAAEGVEATIIGTFTDTRRLVLKYQDQLVGDLSMQFLHDGRPPVVREAVYQPPVVKTSNLARKKVYDHDLKKILATLNVCSKEWIIRQYDHEVQGGSVVKPLVGTRHDGPADAAVVRPNLQSKRGIVVANGMNPRYGDLDPYWMAASAIDEAVRNCVAVGADPRRIAILDNFCWGNTERPETLGSLVRAALGCQDTAVAFGTPFISGKDSLNNEFSYVDDQGEKRTVAIPASLLISALGQIDDVQQAVTMDLKRAGNRLILVGATYEELGGSHYALVNRLQGGKVPRVNLGMAPKIFAGVHAAIKAGLVKSCHDLSEGGLAVALAEMCFSSGLGMNIHLSPLTAQMDQDHEAVLLFSESNSRFVLEVPRDDKSVAAVWDILGPIPKAEIGRVITSPRLLVRNAAHEVVIASDWSRLKTSWQRPLAWE